MTKDRDARTVVRKFRDDPSRPQDEATEAVLQRLEQDSNGEVSAAFHKFRQIPSSLLLFYLLQAVDLAAQRHRVIADSRERAAELRKAAQDARRLAEVCKGQASMALWQTLPALADELDGRATHYEATSGLLQISRKASSDGAEVLLALRHFRKRLREEFSMMQIPHSATEWLLGAALGLKITPEQVREGLRIDGMGIRTKRARSETPNRLKSL